MKESLKTGIEHEFSLTVSNNKTVPALFPESPEFQVMPEVFATGYMVGFIEWACISAINPHIDWLEEQTVGTHKDNARPFLPPFPNGRWFVNESSPSTED
jgi:fluoroacetyl-CoA thioesterase